MDDAPDAVRSGVAKAGGAAVGGSQEVLAIVELALDAHLDVEVQLVAVYMSTVKTGTAVEDHIELLGLPLTGGAVSDGEMVHAVSPRALDIAEVQRRTTGRGSGRRAGRFR